MATVLTTFDKRRGSIRDGKEIHVRCYRVRVEKGEGTPEALHAEGIPTDLQPYSTGSPFLAQSWDCQAVPNTALHFDVTVEFYTLDPLSHAAQKTTEPVQRFPDISYGASEGTEPYFIDKSATPKPVVNSAGEPFEQYLQRDTGARTITYTRNEASFDPNAMDAYKNTTNDAAVTIDGVEYPTDTLKLAIVTAQKVSETWRNEGVDTVATYYKVTYPLKHRAEGWHDHPLDVGYQCAADIDGTTGKISALTPIVNAAGVPVSKPWPLDGEGAAASLTAAPIELDFVPYAPADWTDLHLEYTGGTFPPTAPEAPAPE